MVPTLRRRRSVVLSVITALIGIILHHHTNSVLAMSWGVTAPYTPTYLVRCVLVATPPNSVSSLVFTFWEDEAVGTRIRTEIYDPIQHSWGAPSAIGPLAGGVMSIAALPASASAAATGLQSEWNAGAVLVEGYSTPAIYHYDLDLLKFTNSDQPMRFNPPALNVAQAIQTLHRMTSDPTHFIATLYQSSPFQLGRITIPNGPHTSSTVWPITFITGTGTAPSAQLYYFSSALDDSRNRLYITGGIMNQQAPGLATLFIFDIASSVWSTGPPSPEIHYAHQSFVFQNQLIITGGTGIDSGDPFARISVLQLDPTPAPVWAVTSNTTALNAVFGISAVSAGGSFSSPQRSILLGQGQLSSLSGYTMGPIDVSLPISIDPHSGVANWQPVEYNFGALPAAYAASGIPIMASFTPLTQHTARPTRALFIGGTDLNGVTSFTAVHTFDLYNLSWSNPLHLSGPEPLPAVSQHSATLTGDDASIIIFGGCGVPCASTIRNGTWRLRTSDWLLTRIIQPSGAPLPRYGHSLTLLRDGRTMLLIGGVFNGYVQCIDPLNGLFGFDSVSNVWGTLETTTDDPTFTLVRQFQSTHLVGNALYVVGGCQTTAGAIPVAILDLRTMQWTSVVGGYDGTWAVLCHHAAVVIGTKILAFATQYTDSNAWIFDTTTLTWGKFPVGGIYSCADTGGCGYGEAVTTGYRVILMAGPRAPRPLVLQTGMREVWFNQTRNDFGNRTPNNAACIATNSESVACQHFSAVYPQFSPSYQKFVPVSAGAYLTAGVSTDYVINSAYRIVARDPALFGFAFNVPFTLLGASADAAIDCSPGSGFAQLRCLTIAVSTANSDPTILSDLTLQNSVFGALAVSQQSSDQTVQLNRLQFVNNSYAAGGDANNGAALVLEAGSVISVVASRFDSNSAPRGGAIFIRRFSVLTIIDSVFQSCRATTADGGAISGVGNSLEITNSRFMDCTSSGDGGAVSEYFGVVAVANCTFLRNANGVNSLASSAVGGAIAVAGQSLITVGAGSTFDSNVATGNGGAISVTDASSILVSDSKIVRNTAGSGGGGLSVDFSSNAVVRSCNFVSNTALATVTSAGGGAVFSGDGCTTTIDAATSFVGNACPACGGGAAFWVFGAGASFCSASTPARGANTALFGSEFATNPNRLSFMNLNAVTIPQVSGSLIQPPISISVLDYYNSTVMNDQSTTVLIGPLAAFAGGTVVLARNGSLVFADATVQLKPGQSSAVTFTSTNGFALPVISLFANPCVAGQYINPFNQLCTDCDAGSWSGASSASACTSCLPGTSNPDSGAHAPCAVCDSGFYAPTSGAAQCQACSGFTNPARTDCRTGCAPGEYPSVTLHVCVECSGGSFSLDGTACVLCPPGRYSNETAATHCATCNVGRFKSDTGVGICHDCRPGAVARANGTADCAQCQTGYGAWPAINDCAVCNGGLSCSGGAVTVLPDYWLPELITHPIESGGVSVTAYLCPPNHCNAVQMDEFGRANGCGQNREPAATNPLCGRCQSGFSEWYDQCLTCTESSGGLVFFMLLISAAFTAVLYKLSQDTDDPSIQTFLYFVATLRVLVSEQRSWLSWIGIFDFSPISIPTVCPFPLTPLQSLTLSIVSPLLYIGWLLAAALMHALLTRLSRTRPNWLCGGRWSLSESDQFRKRRYMRALITTLISSYTSVTTALFASLDCTSYPGVSVVFTYPAIACDDTAYKSLLAFVYAMIALITAGIPIGMIAIVVLARRRRRAFLVNGGAAVGRGALNDDLTRSHTVSLLTAADTTAFDDANSGSSNHQRKMSVASIASQQSQLSLFSIGTDSTLAWFSTVYALYRPSYDWWGVVAIARRTIMVTVALALSQSPFERQRVFIVCCILFCVIQVLAIPLRTERDNRFESGSLLLLVFVAVLAISPVGSMASSVGVLPVASQVLISLIVVTVFVVFMRIKIVPLIAPHALWCWAFVTCTVLPPHAGKFTAASSSGSPMVGASLISPPVSPAPPRAQLHAGGGGDAISLHQLATTTDPVMCCGGLYSRCVHVAFGRLTTQQRLVFIAMIGLAFGFGAYYLNYVITKAQFASANPSTVLLSQSITTDSGIVAFPSFQLQVFAVYTGPQSCAATGEVWIQTGYPLNNTLGPAQRLNESRWSTDIIAQQLYPTMFVVTIPSHAWSIVNPMGLSIRLTLSNWNEHVCGLQLGVTSVDDLAPSQWAYSSSTDLRSGRKTFVALQGSADERLNKSVITHVQARFTASEPTNNALGNDSSTSIYVMSFNEGTLFQLAWRKQTIDYGWQDAAAALLAVLNVAWAVITFVYPNAVYAPHQRIYFRDIPSAHVNGTDPDRQLFVDKLIVTVQTGATTTAAGTSGGDTDAAVPTNPMLHSSA